jgi:hypothetical protein
MFQWKYPTDEVTIYGAVMLVNDKPQGIMYQDPCSDSTTKNYIAPPVYYTFKAYRSLIIPAAEGNVDNQ